MQGQIPSPCWGCNSTSYFTQLTFPCRQCSLQACRAGALILQTADTRFPLAPREMGYAKGFWVGNPDLRPPCSEGRGMKKDCGTSLRGLRLGRATLGPTRSTTDSSGAAHEGEHRLGTRACRPVLGVTQGHHTLALVPKSRLSLTTHNGQHTMAHMVVHPKARNSVSRVEKSGVILLIPTLSKYTFVGSGSGHWQGCCKCSSWQSQFAGLGLRGHVKMSKKPQEKTPRPRHALPLKKKPNKINKWNTLRSRPSVVGPRLGQTNARVNEA